MRYMKLAKYSLGLGDRFSHQAEAQLKAIMLAKEKNVLITPVWNKSYREHQLIGSTPATTRQQADEAVKNLAWSETYFVDADHINLKNVDFFIDSCDFFTLDVADAIGHQAAASEVKSFIDKYSSYVGELPLTGLNKSIRITAVLIRQVAEKYLFAAQQAGEIYRHIKKSRLDGNFIVEVSMDETDQPQTPLELFFILAALADRQIPVQTLAPKFSGRFNKGVDYVGDLDKFRDEFEQDTVILKTAIRKFKLPADLKLSVHSGSDKFSLYPVIRQVIRKHDAGMHLKTAGTTWLEELIGLAEGNPAALQLAKDIYCRSLEKYDELCAPYATVIDIDKRKLPGREQVQNWDGLTFSTTLRHDQQHKNYNPHFRQLLHVGYKIAAEQGELYLNSLRECREVIAGNVTTNLFERHIKPLFLE
jgi:hypothetical protein